jgi:hypothetical protein
MVKLRVIRKVVYLFPLNRIALFPGLLYFVYLTLLLGGLSLNLTVTIHTGVEPRNRGIRTLTDTHVAVLAIYFINTSVGLVTKLDRLLWSIALSRVYTTKDEDRSK